MKKVVLYFMKKVREDGTDFKIVKNWHAWLHDSNTDALEIIAFFLKTNNILCETDCGLTFIRDCGINLQGFVTNA